MDVLAKSLPRWDRGVRRTALFSAIRLLPWVSIETISGQTLDPADPQRLWHPEFCPAYLFNLFHLSCRQYRTASRENHMQRLEFLAVFGQRPHSPLPTTSFTPVCSINSRSKLSIRILVVGPTDTISHLSPFLRTMGPAWKIALPLRS